MDSPSRTRRGPNKSESPSRCSAIGARCHRKYGLYDPEYKAARRVNYVIDKNGRVIEMQLDNDAIDPSKVVVACQAQKLGR